jgi:AcrR family transcriptional regulator
MDWPHGMRHEGKPIAEAERRPMNREDHRVRTAATRRERTRAKLMEAALLVFGEHGAEAIVIDEVIRLAGVARGTFYNYFRGNGDLLDAVASEAGDEMMQIIDPVVRLHTDPAQRVSDGIRLWLRLCRDYPHLGAFLHRAGAHVLSHNSLVRDFLPRDLAAGIESGRIPISDPRLAFDLVTGAVLAATGTLLTQDVPADYPDRLAASVMLALSIEPEEARRIGSQPLRHVAAEPSSLIARSGVLNGQKDAASTRE